MALQNQDSSGPSQTKSARMKEADSKAAAQSPNASPNGATQTCPATAREVIEILLVGEDRGPVSKIPISLGRDDGKEIKEKTNAEGAVRIEGLNKGAYFLCLNSLDAGAWELADSKRLDANKAQGGKSAHWVEPDSKKMKGETTHSVQNGECIIHLAEEYGFHPDTIWSEKKNSELRDRRQDPACLVEGDKVVIPAMTVKTEKVETGMHYTVKRKGVPEVLSVELLDDNLKPLANTRYILKFKTDTGRVIEDRSGTTDAKGFLTERIPADAVSGEAILDDPEGPMRVEFEFGSVKPIDIWE